MPVHGLVQWQAMAGDKLWVAGAALEAPANPPAARLGPGAWTAGRRPQPPGLPAFEPGPDAPNGAATNQLRATPWDDHFGLFSINQAINRRPAELNV